MRRWEEEANGKRVGCDLFTPLPPQKKHRHFGWLFASFGFGFRHKITLVFPVKAASATARDTETCTSNTRCILTQSEDASMCPTRTNSPGCQMPSKISFFIRKSYMLAKNNVKMIHNIDINANWVHFHLFCTSYRSRQTFYSVCFLSRSKTGLCKQPNANRSVKLFTTETKQTAFLDNKLAALNQRCPSVRLSAWRRGTLTLTNRMSLGAEERHEKQTIAKTANQTGSTSHLRFQLTLILLCNLQQAFDCLHTHTPTHTDLAAVILNWRPCQLFQPSVLSPA